MNDWEMEYSKSLGPQHENSSEYIFVVGDSRTGTMTLHQFLISAGFNSIHYYFKESGVKEGVKTTVDSSGAEISNWEILKRFIKTSQFNAFSDYPTRSYFRELMSEFPNAKFILTKRKDLETWERSMTHFMEKFGLKIDLAKLSKIHTRLNEEIRNEARDKNIRFLEVNIDGPNEENERALSEFLGLSGDVRLGHENMTKSYNTRLWSQRLTFFNSNSDDVVEYTEQALAGHKGILSEHGWIFLANDSSNFLSFLFGKDGWSEDDFVHATQILEERRAKLGQKKIIYRKYLVPEKSAVYPEYLPRIFQGLALCDTRPSRLVEDAGIDGFSYLQDVLVDVKSRGFLFFRGDSHTNWLGSYFVYLHIIETLNADLEDAHSKSPISLSSLRPQLVAYRGDLADQVRPDHAGLASGAWQLIGSGDVLDYYVKYDLPEKIQTSKRKPFPPEMQALLGEREQYLFSNSDKTLPKAVVFRDSTSDFIVNLLAEHFSECLFIWHKGAVYEDIVDQFDADIVLHIQAERFFSAYPQLKAFHKLYPVKG